MIPILQFHLINAPPEYPEDKSNNGMFRKLWHDGQRLILPSCWDWISLSWREIHNVQLVRCIRGVITCPTEVEVVVEDIRRSRNLVWECEVVFVRRSANGVADALAKDDLQGPGVRTWEVRPPNWLLSPLGEDNRLISCI
ncbi:hypothetical protein RHMOL_Rhmol02G0222100 [Rhododendron molle]|uniref:Uncharacterized protein n=1 Tax=Rhododendron molle TaxID=49168 RepID=A0ACC0PSQ0_RHOML|nr:hypothetical protein RHMOL_Rhmol02G0222100 [Rhododendron molle]